MGSRGLPVVKLRTCLRCWTAGGGGAIRKGSVTTMGAFPIRNRSLRISKGLLVQKQVYIGSQQYIAPKGPSFGLSLYGAYQISISAQRSIMHNPGCTPLLLAKFGTMHTHVIKEVFGLPSWPFARVTLANREFSKTHEPATHQKATPLHEADNIIPEAF